MSETITVFLRHAAVPHEPTSGPIGRGLMTLVQPTGTRGPAAGHSLAVRVHHQYAGNYIRLLRIDCPAQFLEDIDKSRPACNHFQGPLLGEEQCPNPVLIDAGVRLQLFGLARCRGCFWSAHAHLHELPLAYPLASDLPVPCRVAVNRFSVRTRGAAMN
jgi:hypothetical protein